MNAPPLGLTLALLLTSPNRVSIVAQPNEALEVARLRCENRVNPTGLDVMHPRLSWIVASDERGQKQSVFHILVASSPEALARDEGDLWDSGKVLSDQTSQVFYEGKPLSSRQLAWWKIRVWDKDRLATSWSSPAHWSMGLLNRSDWQAAWIADTALFGNTAAKAPLNGYHTELANHPDSAKWVTLDLGGPQNFDSVRLFPARPYDWQPDTAGFLFPRRFKIEVAQQQDFSDSQVLVDRTASDEPNPGTNAPIYRFPAAQGRFVRLLVTILPRRDDTDFGFALAEMEVLHEGTNLARNAPVQVLDSIETGPWAKANLTDGVVQTVPPGGVAGALPATLLRKQFTVSKSLRQATAYVTALGLYELHLNSQRVGEQLLAPEWTSYRKRMQYQVYDVTRLLRPGENAVGALLGEGWYAGRLMVVGRFAYGTFPQFFLQLELEFTDGTGQTVSSDGSWKSTTDGPIRSAGIYDGEIYDAAHEQSGWDMPGFNDSGWRNVRSLPVDSRQLVWQRNEPIEIEQELRCLKITEPKPGAYVLDFGQNMVGWCRFRGQATKEKAITLRHGEMLNDDGTLYTANLRGAPQVDRYLPAADGEFSLEPHFTYHGFRYVEVTGLGGPPLTNSALGRVFHSAAPPVGRFECSDPSINQLMRNVLWTERANLMSSPNDCPQRDERFGWMGDIQAFAQTAVFNMDLAAFFSKWTQDIRDDQADDGRFPDFAPHPADPNAQFSGVPAWGDAGVIVPWRAYQNYGDTELLAASFGSACRWVDYIHRLNPNLIWERGRNNDYNDWLNGDWVKQAGWPTNGASVPKDLFATAFFAHSTDLVAKMADVLHRADEAKRYHELFTQIKTAFNARFVRPDGRLEGDTQGGYALALNFDLLPMDLRTAAAQHLVKGIHRYGDHLSTGIQTTHRALLELTRYGYQELAWQLVTNRTFPSWLYMIDNGATTIWERWDGYVRGRGFQDAGMNSFNHWAFGAVGEWIWRNVAGLNPDDAQAGWKHFVVWPRPGGGVIWAKAEYDSIHGPIASSWRKEGATFYLKVSVPANTTATVILPARDAAGLSESGKPAAQATGVKFLRFENGRAAFEVQSGRYEFTSVSSVD
ncbi:MAG TPA: family 78 glycoside hydrolase catalytic domain [Candidatus Limnocylindrales bacterium]|nr:family 78 glycoside hydrolase catalytic domain [Candidatus Limnocylindrales bacterium]